MIPKRTVIVVGAGANVDPFGFPTGAKLVNDVLKELEQPPSVEFLKEHFGTDPAEIAEFTKALSYSGKMSVDAFLEHRPDFLEIGKLSMAMALIRCENIDRLFSLSDQNWLIPSLISQN